MDEPTPRRRRGAQARPGAQSSGGNGRGNPRPRPPSGAATRTAGSGNRARGRSAGRPPATRRPAVTPEHFQPAVAVTRPLVGATRPPDVTGGLAPARAAALLPVAIAVIGLALLIAVNVAIGVVLIVLGVGIALANRSIGSPARLAARIPTRAADNEHEARLINLTDALCIGLGVPFPTLRILEDDAPNAITLGRDASSAVLICSTGLLGLLDRMELEGVIAHELAHAKRGDLDRAAATTTALGLLALLTPATAGYVRRLAGPEGESLADLRGVGITRYPPGLAMALEKIAASGRTVPAGLDNVVVRLTGPRWCAPFGVTAADTVVPGVLSVAERAAALREL